MDIKDQKIIKAYRQKQFSFWIGTELHRLIKADAALRGMSVSMWVESALVKAIEDIKKYE